MVPQHGKSKTTSRAHAPLLTNTSACAACIRLLAADGEVPEGGPHASRVTNPRWLAPEVLRTGDSALPFFAVVVNARMLGCANQGLTGRAKGSALRRLFLMCFLAWF